MQPTPPFWFKQRQCKAEPAGADGVLKLTGPNLPEAYIRIEPVADGHYRAALRLTADGPDVRATDADLPNLKEAWDAAFELYRLQVIV